MYFLALKGIIFL